MTWPNPKAKGGAFIDRCVISPDGNSYSGKNQSGNKITGRLSQSLPTNLPPTGSVASKGTMDPIDTLENRLKGTKWVNDNKATFEWTTDGRFLHQGNERKWKVLDGKRVQITFDPNHSDTLVFNEATTEFEQIVPGYANGFRGKRKF